MKKITFILLCIFLVGCTYSETDYPFVGKYYYAKKTDTYLQEEYRVFCNQYKRLIIENNTTGYIYPSNTYKISGNYIIARDKNTGKETMRIFYDYSKDCMEITYGAAPLYNGLSGLVFTRK